MELIPVKTTDPYYAEAERLMTDAFPPEERRPLDRQRQYTCLLYTSPSPRDAHESRMPSSA